MERFAVMKYILGLALLALTACGIDGAPITPSMNVGVTVSSDGVTPRASVGVRKGPLSVGVGL